MFIRTYNLANHYDISIRNSFEYYRADIMTLQKAAWKDEDLEGSSCKYGKLMQYYAAIYLGAMILSVFTGSTLTWEETITKYCLNKKKKDLACNGIDLDTIFGFFGLPPVTDCGIDGMGVQDTFEVEPSISPCNNTGHEACEVGIEDTFVIEEPVGEVEPTEIELECGEGQTIDIAAWLAQTCACTIYIQQQCSC